MKLKKGKIVAITLLSSAFLFVVAPAVLAQVASGPEDVDALIGIVDQVATWFQTIVLIIGIIMIIAAGLTWMTAGGNDEKLTTARKMLIWGLIGIAVALFAYMAETFVISVI